MSRIHMWDLLHFMKNTELLRAIEFMGWYTHNLKHSLIFFLCLKHWYTDFFLVALCSPGRNLLSKKKNAKRKRILYHIWVREPISTPKARFGELQNFFDPPLKNLIFTSFRAFQDFFKKNFAWNLSKRVEFFFAPPKVRRFFFRPPHLLPGPLRW